MTSIRICAHHYPRSGHVLLGHFSSRRKINYFARGAFLAARMPPNRQDVERDTFVAAGFKRLLCSGRNGGPVTAQLLFPPHVIDLTRLIWMLF